MLKFVWLALVCWIGLNPVTAQEIPAALTAARTENATTLFEGRGVGHWDVKLRERGWILIDPPLRPGEKARWHLWFTGYDGTREGVKQLGYATSENGVDWHRHPRNPIHAEHWVEDMMVVKHGDKFVMFAEGKDDQAQQLESLNGVDWTRIGVLDVRLKSGQPIEPGPYGTPTVWFENDVWHLFYERRDAGVWLATSRDRRVWINDRDEPVLVPGPGEHELDLIAMNQVLKHDGKYYGLYHGSKRGSGLWSSNIAVSDDLRQWKKWSGNPLVHWTNNESSPLLIQQGDQFWFFTMHDKVRLRRPAGR